MRSSTSDTRHPPGCSFKWSVWMKLLADPMHQHSSTPPASPRNSSDTTRATRWMGTASHKRSHRVPKERTWDELIVQALPSKRPHSSLSPPDGPVPYMATPETDFTIDGGWWHGTSECSNVKVRITNLETSDESLVREIATMLVTGFREKAPEAYPTLTTARAEVRESFCT
jgi:hypothetical protein